MGGKRIDLSEILSRIVVTTGWEGQQKGTEVYWDRVLMIKQIKF